MNTENFPHQLSNVAQEINFRQRQNFSVWYRYTRPLLIFGIYMQNCKLLELAMPNMQVLKFSFPVKESTIAQHECLTVDTLIQVKGREIL